MKTAAASVVLVFLAFLTACGGGSSSNSVTTPPPTVTLQSIAVAPAAPSISVGVSEQFKATGTYSDGSTKDLTNSATWSSSTASVANVNNAGLAQAVTPGTTTIKATSGSVSGSTTMTVTPVTLVGVSVTPGTPTIAVGSTQQFTANANYSNNTSKNIDILVSWTSSNPAVATIGATGLATSLTTGSTTITATQGTTKATATLNVGPVPTPTVFVSPTGNDSNPCSATAPCLTPQRATAVVDTVTTNRNVQFTCTTSPCTYYLSSPWTMGAGDSGSPGNPITYSAAPGNSVTISGGTQVSGWTNTSGNLWQASLPASFNSYSPLAIFYNGTRRFLPQVGATSTSTLGAYYRVAAQVTTCSSPNGSTVCYDRFQYGAGDPLDSAAIWANYATSNGASGNTFCTAGGLTGQQGDIEILIFERWTMSRQRVACVDTTNHIVYLTGTTNPDNNHGYLVGHRYIIENVLQSRDSSNLPVLQPGQFFVDRSASPYTIYYEAQTGEFPSTDTIVVPTLQPGGTQDAPTGALLSANGLHDVTFSGLQFSHDNFFPPATGYASTQADTHVPAALTCMNCTNVVFDSNVFTQTVGYGLGFYTDGTGSGLTGNIVQNNAFYDVGAGGLIVGNQPASGDSNSNIYSQAIINNNIVSGYGRAFPGSSGLEVRFGHDIAITFNEVNDGYNAGIGICVPDSNTNCGGAGTAGAMASNLTVQFNHVWNLGQGVTDDFGGIYIPTYLSTGNTVYNNKVHDTTDAQTQDSDGYGGRCIYVDSTTGNVDVENNLVYRCSANAWTNTAPPAAAGNSNTVKNNIFAFSRPGMNLLESSSGFTVPTYLIATFTNNIYYMDRTASSSCGSSLNSHDCAFSFMQGCGPLTSSPTVAQIYTANLYFNTATDWSSAQGVMYTSDVNCSNGTLYSFSGWQGLGQDAGSAIFNPNFVSPGCSLTDAVSCATTAGQDDYDLTGVAPGQTLTISSGNTFTAFDLTVPGRNNPVLAPPAVAPSWQTKPMNPASDY